MGKKIVNKEEIEANRKGQEEILNYLYPDRVTDEERQLLRQEYERRKHDKNSQNQD